MRLLAVLFLIIAALRPMPVMATMPADAHAMMMEGEAGHCNDQQTADRSSHDQCGECCLSVMPPIDFGQSDAYVPATRKHEVLALLELNGHGSASDPPPPRA